MVARSPGLSHADPIKGEDKKVFVPSITFNDDGIFTKIKKAIKKELEEDFGMVLTEFEEI